MSPAADAPKHTTTVIGGRQVEFPLVPLLNIAVGQAMRENLQVGVLASFPNAPLVDGILGGSFLKDFTMTLDYATSRLRLVLKAPLPTLPPISSLALATMHSAVPIQLVGNHVLVRAVLNHTEHVTLLLDTGSMYTLLTPTTAQRLGPSPPADAPRRILRGADGQPHEVPFVQLSAIAVGKAMRENLPVGISVLFPRAPSVDGLLGGNSLEQFKMTLDRGTARCGWSRLKRSGRSSEAPNALQNAMMLHYTQTHRLPQYTSFSPPCILCLQHQHRSPGCQHPCPEKGLTTEVPSMAPFCPHMWGKLPLTICLTIVITRYYTVCLLHNQGP